jgi:hypothetical protein
MRCRHYLFSYLGFSKATSAMSRKTDFVQAAESPPEVPKEEIKEPEPVRSLFQLIRRSP